MKFTMLLFNELSANSVNSWTRLFASFASEDLEQIESLINLENYAYLNFGRPMFVCFNV